MGWKSGTGLGKYQQGLYRHCVRVSWNPSCIEMLSYELIVYMEEGRKGGRGKREEGEEERTGKTERWLKSGKEEEGDGGGRGGREVKRWMKRGEGGGKEKEK